VGKNSYSKKEKRQTLRQNHTVSPQDCTVRPRKGAGQSSLAGRHIASSYKIRVLDCPPILSKSKAHPTPLVNPLFTLSFSKTVQTQGHFTDHWMELRANKLIGCETHRIWETNLQPFGVNVPASIDIMSAMFFSIY
jgi:hypothetical protein